MDASTRFSIIEMRRHLLLTHLLLGNPNERSKWSIPVLIFTLAIDLFLHLIRMIIRTTLIGESRALVLGFDLSIAGLSLTYLQLSHESAWLLHISTFCLCHAFICLLNPRFNDYKLNNLIYSSNVSDNTQIKKVTVYCSGTRPFCYNYMPILDQTFKHCWDCEGNIVLQHDGFSKIKSCMLSGDLLTAEAILTSLYNCSAKESKDVRKVKPIYISDVRLQDFSLGLKIEENSSEMHGCYKNLKLKPWDIFNKFHIRIIAVAHENNHVSRYPFEGSIKVNFLYMYLMSQFVYYKNWKPSPNNEEPLPACSYTERLEYMSKFIESLPKSKNNEKLGAYMRSCISWYHGKRPESVNISLMYRSRWSNHLKWILGSAPLAKIEIKDSQTGSPAKIVKEIIVEEEVVKIEDYETQVKTAVPFQLPSVNRSTMPKDISAGLYSEMYKKLSKPKMNPIWYTEFGNIPINTHTPIGVARKTGMVTPLSIFQEHVIEDEWVIVTKGTQKLPKLVHVPVKHENFYGILSTVKVKNEAIPKKLCFDEKFIKEEREKKDKMSKKGNKKQKSKKQKQPKHTTINNFEDNLRKLRKGPLTLDNPSNNSRVYEVTRNWRLPSAPIKKRVSLLKVCQELCNLNTKSPVHSVNEDILVEILETERVSERVKKRIGTYKFNDLFYSVFK